MTAGAAIGQGAFLGFLALFSAALIALAVVEHGWRVVAKFFAVAVTILAFPVGGALISYTIVIGW